MRKKEYLQFYKLETEPDKKGRERTRAQYTGDYFTIVNKPEEVKRIRIIILAVLAFFTAAGTGLLFLDIVSAYKVYIVIPNLLAIAGAAGALYYSLYLFIKGGKFTIFQKVKVEVRLRQTAAFSAALAGLTTLIRTFFLIIARPQSHIAAEIIMVLYAFILIFALLYSLQLAKKIRFESINIPSE